MRTIPVFSYHPRTREYLGTDFGQESPLEPGVFLVPACATKLAPPAVAAGHVAVFDPVAECWRVEARRSMVPPSFPVPVPSRSVERARARAMMRLEAFTNEQVEAIYRRESALQSLLQERPNDIEALDAFDPAALWGS